MKSIDSTLLGEFRNIKILRGLIPDGWSEMAYEHNDFWSVKCMRDAISMHLNSSIDQDREFGEVCHRIEEEFCTQLMGIYSITSGGINFIVYLKK